MLNPCPASDHCRAWSTPRHRQVTETGGGPGRSGPGGELDIAALGDLDGPPTWLVEVEIMINLPFWSMPT
jgi:hypothetical protein